MNFKTLRDEKTRESAIKDHSQSIFIDAGAGTGKTETIVKRIVDRLLTDDEIDMLNVAAITFTDKAGAELRNRFRKVLRDAQATDDEVQSQTINNYIHQVDSAAIGTIHAFCKRILTDYSIAANLPVGFSVSSEDAGPSLRRERVKLVTELAWDSLSTQEIADLRDQDVTIAKMRNLVTEMDAKFPRLSSLTINLDEVQDNWEKAAYRFIQLAIAFLKSEQITRRNKGSIEFDDLLMLTRDLLKSEAELRRLVATSFKVMVVDEFQDTDPIQWEIIQMVVSPEEIDKPKPGSLVLVGDPKQSIYRFRNADLHTFLKVKELFLGEGSFGAAHDLTSNFRTVNPVIDFVNQLFADDVAGKSNPLSMGVSYNKLDFVHSPVISNPGPPVVVIPNPKTLDDLVEFEFKQVASEILKAVRNGYAVTKRTEDNSRVYDENRRANFGDICILLPVRTHIAKLVSQLNASGIPFRSADPGILFDLPLVVGLVNTLKVIALTDDDMALMVALKSPIFGLNDNQLHEYISVQGSSWSTEGSAIGDSPTANALNSIFEMRKSCGLGRPSQAIKVILERQRIFDNLVSDKNGNFESNALRMLLTHAYNWENQGNVGLLDYLDALDVLMDEKSRITLPIPAELNNDAVQIMTIHGAKGLEFPITVVAGLASQKSNNPDKLLISRSGQIEFNLGKNTSNKAINSSGYVSLEAGEITQEELQEDNRLLYVAMTRAQDHLIVSAVGLPTGGHVPRSRQLMETLEIFKNANVTLPFKESNHQLETPYTEDVESSQNNIDYMETFEMDFSAEIASTEIRRVVSPSADAATNMKLFSGLKMPNLSIPNRDEQFDFEDDSQSGRALAMRQRDGRPFGRAFHGIMDLIIRHGAVPSSELLDTFIHSKALDENAMEFVSDLKQRVELLLANPIVLEALASTERYPELHLAIADPSDEIKLAEGFADLVYLSHSGGYVLVDYKTDQEIQAEQLLHYSQQLGAYAIILEAITGNKPERVLLLHARPDGVSVIPL